MRKKGLMLMLLSCILMGGCIDTNGGEQNVGKETLEQLTPPITSVEEEKNSPVPTESADVSLTDPPLTDPPLTDPPLTGLPVTCPPLTDPPLTEPPVTEPSLTEPPVTEPPVQITLEVLGVDLEYGPDGEEIYKAPTCFFDDNGLLCVQIKATCQKEAEWYVLEKSYYLADGTLCRETEQVSAVELTQIFEGKIVEETYITKACEPISYKMLSGYVWTKNGEMVKVAELLGESYSTQFVCTDKENYIPVTPGERILLDYYFSWFSEVAGILFLDDNDQLVSAFSFNSSTRVKNQYLTVPEGAFKMHLTMYNNQEYSLKREVALVGADLSVYTEEVYAEQSEKIFSSVEKRSMKQYTLDKAYITFVLDDCRPDMDKIADIFAEYNVPLCIAAVYENLPYAASNGTETRLEVCERIVDNGGEILAHDAEVITEELLYDYNCLAQHFYVNKWKLEQLGFEINGVVLAGGTGQIVGHSATDIWARNFYQYSDLYGETKYGEPYYHRRFWLGNALSSYQNTITDAVMGNEWVVFYLHDLKEVDSATLREILQFVTSFSSSSLETVTYKTLYDKMW